MFTVAARWRSSQWDGAKSIELGGGGVSLHGVLNKEKSGGCPFVLINNCPPTGIH